MGASSILSLFGFIIILPFIVVLIYISLKYGSKYSRILSNGNVIKVVERVPINQNTFLCVVLIDNKPYVITNGDKGASIFMKLDDEIVERYDLNKKYAEMPKISYSKFVNAINIVKEKFKHEKNQ